MAFHDVSLPSDFQYGSGMGAGFATIVQQTASGHEFRVARQAQGLHRLSLRKELQSSTEAQTLKAFALARRGALHSFRVKDWSDYSSASDGQATPTTLDVILGTGNGTTVKPSASVCALLAPVSTMARKRARMAISRAMRLSPP